MCTLLCRGYKWMLLNFSASGNVTHSFEGISMSQCIVVVFK